jgi:hypothetical protein
MISRFACACSWAEAQPVACRWLEQSQVRPRRSALRTLAHKFPNAQQFASIGAATRNAMHFEIIVIVRPKAIKDMKWRPARRYRHGLLQPVMTKCHNIAYANLTSGVELGDALVPVCFQIASHREKGDHRRAELRKPGPAVKRSHLVALGPTRSLRVTQPISMMPGRTINAANNRTGPGNRGAHGARRRRRHV